MSVYTHLDQFASACNLVRKHDIGHLALVHANVIVGVSPEDTVTDQPQTIHFCASIFESFRIIRESDGWDLPQYRKPQVILEDKLPEVTDYGILLIPMLIRSNGKLVFSVRGECIKFSPLPECVRKGAPFSHAGGLEEIAEAYGYADVRDVFYRERPVEFAL